MRKAISIALSLCILLASFSGAIIGTAIADNATSVNLGDAANWGVYGKGAAVDGSQNGKTYGGWQGATTVNNFAGKEVATKVSARDTVAGLAIPVDANSHYTFTLNYFVPTSAAYHSYFNDSYMGSIGIYAPNAVFTGDPAKYVSGGAVLATSADKQGVAGAWTKIEFEFDSGDNTEVFFAGYFIRQDSGTDGNNFYFADFELTKIELNAYNNAANWEIYNASGTLGGQLATNTDNWEKITNVYNFQGKDVAVKAVVRDQVSALPFAVETGKHYTLKFKYFVDSAATMTSLKGVGVYTSGAAFNAGDYKSGGAVLGTAAPEVVSGQWKEVTVEFDSANNTTAYLAAYWLITDNVIYFADFELTKTDVNEYENAANWEMYATYGGTLGGQLATTDNWEKITNAYNFQGKDVVVKAHLRDQVSALHFAVEANKLYTLKFKYFVDSAATITSLESVGVYAPNSAFNNGDYASGGAVLGTATPEVVSGQWKEVTVDFGSANNTTVYLAAYWLITDNVIYFADFELNEYAAPSYYEDGSNWEVYGNAGTLDGSQKGKAYASWMMGSTVYTFEGKDVAVKASVRDAMATLPITVEANKYYTLTFKYFVADEAAYHDNMIDAETGNKYFMKSLGVYAPNSTFSGGGYSWNAGAPLGTVGNEGAQGEWKEVKINFASKENTKVYFAAYCLINTTNSVYFADFDLTELPDWDLYEDYSNNPKEIGTDAAPYSSWKGITESDFVDANAADATSIKIHANDDVVAYKLGAVNANTRYTLTFKYFVPAEDNANEADFLTNAGVYAQGATFGAANALNTTAVSTKGSWEKATVTFDAQADTTVYFAARVTAGAPAYTIYIDDIELAEVAGLQTAYNKMASIRAAETTDGNVKKNGLRAYNQILMGYIEGKQIVEYGSIVVRQAYLKDKYNATNDFTFDDTRKDGTGDLLDYVGRGVGLGVAYRTEDATDTITTSAVAFEGAIDMLWESTSNDKVFTSYVTGISEDYYDDEYLVRAYAIDNDGNVYYGETKSISIFKVAKAMDDKYTNEGNLGDTEAEDKHAFEVFVGATKEKYVEWCGDAGVGNLYNELFSNVQ